MQTVPVYAMTPVMTAHAQPHALLGNAALHFVVTAAALLLLALALAANLDLGPAYTVKALLVFVVGTTLFVPLLRTAHPFGRLGPANRITLVRAGLTAAVAGFIGEEVGSAAASVIVGIGLVSLCLDGFDGHLARRSGMTSPFGSRFDMETDAFLILLFGVLAWQLGKAGSWVVLSGLLRYLFVAAGWVLPWMRAALPYSRRRQVVCVLQIAAMLAVLLPFVTSPWSDALAAAALIVLGYSFLLDVAWLRRYGATQPVESAPSTPAKEDAT
jgi:phosphatidylglycerophosphate synthase